MARYLRQSTSATIRFGPMQSSADGSAATGATLTVKLSKAGGAIGARNDATSITHDSDGYYVVTINTTDTNTVGRLRVIATASGCLPAWEDYAVLSSAVYDWLFGSAAPSTLDAAGVWANATRTLTAGTNISLAKGTGVTGFNDLSASEIRSAIGMASADLDSQLGAIPTANEVADAVLSRSVASVESSAGEHTLCTVILATLESGVSGNTWTIRRTDGTTTHATKTVSTSSSASPIVGVS